MQKCQNRNVGENNMDDCLSKDEAMESQAKYSAKKMKMTTEIPPQILTPDTIETRFGTLRFIDGFPDDATVEKVYDNLDFQHGVQAYLTALPGTVSYALREGLR